MHPRLIYLGLIFSVVAFPSVPGYYILEMSGDPVAVHVANHARSSGIRGAAAIERRAQIREQQRPIRARLENAQAEILDSVDTVANAFVVRIPEEKAAVLESIPGISRVYPVRRFRLRLDRAVPLHHVPEAWQQVGFGNAGAGVKIAIIDTGIDIEHPGFQDSSLSTPNGFPRANNPADLAFT